MAKHLITIPKQLITITEIRNEAYKWAKLDLPELVELPAASYKFAHDRIQQAAYSLIPAERKQAVHRQVGRQMLTRLPAERREEALFEIVQQLNAARDLIEEDADREELARLNLRAGEKAKSAAAYDPTAEYLRTGLALLDEASWQNQYDLSLALHVAAAEVAFLQGEFARMEQLCGIVVREARTVLDKVPAHDIQLQALGAQNKQARGGGARSAGLGGARCQASPQPQPISPGDRSLAYEASSGRQEL